MGTVCSLSTSKRSEPKGPEPINDQAEGELIKKHAVKTRHATRKRSAARVGISTHLSLYKHKHTNQ